MTSECTVCHRIIDTRLGVCWDCAEAESIIDEGLDMWGRGLFNDSMPATTPMDKVRLLLDCRAPTWPRDGTQKFVRPHRHVLEPGMARLE